MTALPAARRKEIEEMRERWQAAPCQSSKPLGEKCPACGATARDSCPRWSVFASALTDHWPAIRDLLAALPEWREIESAPKDNKPVLLFSQYEGIGAAIWWRNKWHWWADGAVIEYQSDFGTEYKTFDAPTHFMPLPEPPA